MPGSSYTEIDPNNTLGFVVSGAAVSTPGVLPSFTDTPSGNVLQFLDTTGLFIGGTVSGINIPFGTQIQSLTPGAVTMTHSILGDIPDSTPITFRNPFPLVAKSKDPKTNGKYYVEFSVDNIGVGSNAHVSFGVAMLGASITGLWNHAGMSALLDAQGNVFVSGGASPVRPGGVFLHTLLDAPPGSITLILDSVGALTDDNVVGANIPAHTSAFAASGGFVTMDTATTGDIPPGTGISFFRKALVTGDVISAAVDLDNATIAFRKIGATVGAWTDNFDISGLNIAGGIVLAITDTANNGGFAATLVADPGPTGYPLSHTIPTGFMPGWPVNKFSDDLGVAKLTAVAQFGPPNLAVRKAGAAMLLGPPNLAVRKLDAYAFFRPAFFPPADKNRARVTIIG